MALAEHRIAHREAAACTCNSHCRNVVVFCRLTRTYLPNSNTHINTGRLAACHGKLWEDIFVGLRLKDLQIAKNVLPSVLSEQRHKKALVSVTARGRQFGTKHSVAEPTLVSTTLSEFVCLRA